MLFTKDPYDPFIERATFPRCHESYQMIIHRDNAMLRATPLGLLRAGNMSKRAHMRLSFLFSLSLSFFHATYFHSSDEVAEKKGKGERENDTR